MMTLRLNANDINFLSSIGVVDTDKATNHYKHIDSMKVDRLKKLDTRKPNDRKAISNYYRKEKERLDNELWFY